MLCQLFQLQCFNLLHVYTRMNAMPAPQHTNQPRGSPMPAPQHTNQPQGSPMPAPQHTNQPRGSPMPAPQHTELPSENVSCMLSHYRDYLKSFYSIKSTACDDKLSIAPCNQFINLAIIKKGAVPDAFSRSTFHGGVDEIVVSKTPLEMDALVTPDSRFVLVEGPPGIGKSTLCWELCRQWDTLTSLQRYKIVLQLKLREKRVQNATSLLSEIFYHRRRRNLCQSVVEEVFEV